MGISRFIPEIQKVREIANPSLKLTDFHFKAPQIASPPLLHLGRHKLSSCVHHPVALRPRVGQNLLSRETCHQTLPAGRQCYSAVTSPSTKCSKMRPVVMKERPASAIPGY